MTVPYLAKKEKSTWYFKSVPTVGRWRVVVILVHNVKVIVGHFCYPIDYKNSISFILIPTEMKGR
jgi:hypothetical protein